MRLIHKNFHLTTSCVASIIVVLSLLFSAIVIPFPAAYAIEEEVAVYEVTSAEDIYAALANIGSNESAVISLRENITGLNGMYVNSGKTVTLVGNGHMLTLQDGEGSINISESGVLNLGEKNDPLNTLTISKPTANDTPGVISLQGNARVNMYDGVTICDSENNNYFGGAVSIGGQESVTNTAVFTMYGGTIINCGVKDGSVCFGGGVAVLNGGTFVMKGGSIEDCYAITSNYEPYTLDLATSYTTDTYINVAGGGVFVAGGGTFTMDGGTIKNCKTSFIGGGVAVLEGNNRTYGYIDSKFVMSGGSIEGCAAGSYGGGVALSGQRVSAPSMLAANLQGTTVADPGLDISGGTVLNCSAGECGGGVFLYYTRNANNTVINIKNVSIAGNTADAAGGVLLYRLYTEANISNCVISDNIALGEKTEYLLNGSYTDRTSVAIGTIGGLGITQMNANVNLDGGTIVNNSSTEIGAGVYYRFSNSSYNLKISGKLVIQNNICNGALNNLNIDVNYDDSVYPVKVGVLENGSQIGLSDPKLRNDNLTDEDIAAVSENYLTSDYNINNPEYPDNDPAQYFTSDHSSWIPAYGDIKEPYTYISDEETDWTSKSGNIYYSSRSYGVQVSDTTGVKTQAQALQNLTYDPDTKTVGTGCYSATSYNEFSYYLVFLESVSENKFYLAYCTNSNSAPSATNVYHVIGALPDWKTSSKNTKIGSFPDGLNFSDQLIATMNSVSSVSHDQSDWRLMYSRTSYFSSRAYYKAYILQKGAEVTVSGYDYSSEVHLIRKVSVSLAEVVPGRILNKLSHEDGRASTITVGTDGAATALITAESGDGLDLLCNEVLPQNTSVTMRSENVFYFHTVPEGGESVIPFASFIKVGSTESYSPEGESQTVQFAFVFPGGSDISFTFSISYADKPASSSEAFTVNIENETEKPSGSIGISNENEENGVFSASILFEGFDLEGDSADRRNNHGEDYEKGQINYNSSFDYAYKSVVTFKLFRNGEAVYLSPSYTVILDGEEITSFGRHTSAFAEVGDHSLEIIGLGVGEYTLSVTLTAVDYDARYAFEAPFTSNSGSTSLLLSENILSFEAKAPPVSEEGEAMNINEFSESETDFDPPSE